MGALLTSQISLKTRMSVSMEFVELLFIFSAPSDRSGFECLSVCLVEKGKTLLLVLILIAN